MTIFTPEFKQRISIYKGYIWYFIGYVVGSFQGYAIFRGWI